MKIFLSVGHSILANGNCTSASGVINEYQYCKTLAPIVADMLRASGNDVDLVICPERQFSSKSGERTYKIGIENGKSYDFACELHLNSGVASANGCEVLYKSNSGRTYADRICAKLGELFRNRGVKLRTDLYMLNQTHAPAVIVESFFCSSEVDCGIGVDYEKIARAIAEGISGVAVSTPQPTPVPTPQPVSVPQQTATLQTANEKLKEALGVNPGSATLADANNELKAALGIKGGANIAPSQNAQTAQNAYSVDALGRKHAENFCGEANKSKVLQHALNLDYGAGLNVDGLFQDKSKKALGSHYVKRGECQYMVTALEILLMMNGYDPKGVENPGDFGGNCEYAVRLYQRDHGLVEDGIAGAKTFLSLIA